MWEILECMGGMFLIIALMDFWSDPEEASERLGRCIRAFRRGLSGELTERRDASESTPQPGPDPRWPNP